MYYKGCHKNPLVSVLIPVFNGEKFIRQALISILKQTYRPLEVIIVDDGSTDNSLREIEDLKDNRIILIKNESNRGISYSLNQGIHKARGEFFARMDADDISLPDRIRQQVSFLSNNREIGIVGSAIYKIDSYGRVQNIIFPPETDIEIRFSLLFMSPFAHPTVMIRKKILEDFKLRYDEKLKFAQDYKLWSQILENTEGANISIPLLKYRHHEQSISISKKRHQRDIWNQIRKYNLYNYLEKDKVNCLNLNCMADIVSGEIDNNSKNDLINSYNDIIKIFQNFCRLHRLKKIEKIMITKQVLHPLISNIIYYSLFHGNMTFKERVGTVPLFLKEALKYRYYPSKQGISNKFNS